MGEFVVDNQLIEYDLFLRAEEKITMLANNVSTSLWVANVAVLQSVQNGSVEHGFRDLLESFVLPQDNAIQIECTHQAILLKTYKSTLILCYDQMPKNMLAIIIDLLTLQRNMSTTCSGEIIQSKTKQNQSYLHRKTKLSSKSSRLFRRRNIDLRQARIHLYNCTFNALFTHTFNKRLFFLNTLKVLKQIKPTWLFTLYCSTSIKKAADNTFDNGWVINAIFELI